MPSGLFAAVKQRLPWLTRRRLNLLLKLLVVVLLSVFLYADLHSRNQLGHTTWLVFQRQLLGANHWWLWATLLLMPLNWMTETIKWYQLVRHYDPIAPGRALLAVLAGVSVSLFTPNRTGEFGGRILFIRPENRWKAVIANLVGNYAQFMVLVAAGIVGAGFCLQQLFPANLYRLFFKLSGGLGVLLLLLLYFNIRLFIPLARRIPGIKHIKRFVKDLDVLGRLTRAALAEIAAWALLRYVIFSVQYYCLLQFFGIDLSPFQAFSGISTLFLLQTSLPLPPVTGLVARGDFAVHIWAVFGAGAAASLASTFALFIINLILPALIGVFALMRINIAHSLGYDND